MYDAGQFNGFVKSELDDLLFDDIWQQYIFNESDLHSAAYYYIRKYFERRGSERSRLRVESSSSSLRDVARFVSMPIVAPDARRRPQR